MYVLYIYYIYIYIYIYSVLYIYKLMILVCFPSGGCVDDAASNRANYQFTSVIVIHFMNGAGVCLIIRTVLNVHICLNHS